jgi:hypothetical protein
MKTAMLKKEFDFATWVAKRALEGVQNRAMLEKKSPPVVALGLLIAVDTLLQAGEAHWREAGYTDTADRLASVMKEVALAARAMRTMVRDEVEILSERRPALRPVAALGSVVTGMGEETAE